MKKQEIEKLLGRELSLTESMLFIMFNGNKDYTPIKDKDGNLKYENKSK